MLFSPEQNLNAVFTILLTVNNNNKKLDSSIYKTPIKSISGDFPSSSGLDCGRQEFIAHNIGLKFGPWGIYGWGVCL